MLLSAVLIGSAMAGHYSAWGTAVSAESLPGSSSDINTTSNDGCPIESSDGNSLYTATNRPGGLGGIDIWVAHRSSTDAGFGPMVNLGAAINSEVDDFCPTPVRGKGLFFVSSRSGGCGGADIYFTRNNPSHGWTDPENLGCSVNSALGEAGPAYFEADGQAYLYFSSGPEIMASIQQSDGSFGPAAAVAELNSPAGDFRPNVRKGGLEMVFDSNRTDTLGGQDLYFSTRSSASEPWSVPVNGGSAVNTAAGETRGSFSWDGLRLYFGRTPGPEGGTDIFISSRTR
ncbi:MAG: PD40 domain-containing protein [Chloroflexi bacterium]|nr:PD40 domain-containing protein [Chloroflexota bacterium]